MRLPMPFTITIYGIGYDKGSAKGLFKKDLLMGAIEKAIEEHMADDVEVKYTIETHSFRFDTDKMKGAS